MSNSSASTGNNTSGLSTFDVHQAVMFGVGESYFACLNVVCFFSCLLLRNVQPLKSRYKIPFFVTFIFGILNIPTCIWHVLTLTKVIPDYYNIAIYLFDIAFVCIINAVALQILRLLVFQNMGIIQQKYLRNPKRQQQPNSTKKQLEQEEIYLTVQRKMKVSKFLLSPLFTFLILLPIFLVQLAISLMWMLMLYVGKIRVTTYRVSVVLVFALVPIVICSIMVVYDLVLNKFKIYKLHQFFITKDRLLFRLDYMAGIVAFLCSVVSLGLPMVADTSGPKNYILLVFELIRYTCITLAAGGGNCVLYILWTRLTSSLRFKSPAVPATSRSNSSAEVEMNEEMKVCIYSDEGFKAFMSFVKGEFSQENLECWLSIQEFKRLTSKEARMAHLKEIVYTFILPNSLMEVNIPQPHRMEVVVLYKQLLNPGALAEDLQEEAAQLCRTGTIRSHEKEKRRGSEVSSPKSSTLSDSSSIEVQPLQAASPPTPVAEDRMLAKDALFNLEAQIVFNLQDPFTRFKRTWNYSHLMQTLFLVRKHAGMETSELSKTG